jgi:GH24 family phage-related lysozyme (muramidase)
MTMTWTANKLRDFFKNFDANNPNHLAAADLLQSQMPEVMNDEAKWVKKFREKSTSTPVANSGARVPSQAVHLIKKYEGFRANPYICPAGVPTIGYGNTFYPDGRKVKMGDPTVTDKQAVDMLIDVADKSFVSVLEKKIPYWAEMSDGQKSALISFAYNLGANFYGDTANFGSITRVLKNKEWNLVPEMLLKYRNPGSAFEEGLRKRRVEEGEVWKS